MGVPRPPEPVQLICGVLVHIQDVWTEVRTVLEGQWGPIVRETPWLPFPHTDYYAEQMGTPLWRKWIAFAYWMDPAHLADIKLATNRWETFFQKKWTTEHRVVNLDPGWLHLHQVVLASTKPAAHRIYLGRGIYAEIEYIYQRGAFQPLPWTYPDYRTDEARRFFQEVRTYYRNHRRRWMDRAQRTN